ncbi:MAG: phosphopentomutase [Desulfobacteraceae bacterium 4572_35.1]|nr:MAG: phosphopentomutase [Desulfobacteraceae bacterium 4572_35.1]
MKFKRIVLIVLDGVGCGALPDADEYGDVDANTLAHVLQVNDGLALPTLQRMGLGNIAPLTGVAPVTQPLAAWGKMAEYSIGKDSTTGHWEMAGGVQKQPYAIYPEGFPDEIIAIFTKVTGKKPLGNVVISGTDALVEYGEHHMQSGRPIVYTSVDSVFQIAAHEEVISPDELYAICTAMRAELNSYRIARVIARPFVGSCAEDFTRTPRRRDFSLQPPPNMLDSLAAADIEVIAVGKIKDIFCGRSIARHLPTVNNRDGMAKIISLLSTVERGLIFANLIDYDMLYGHRRDAVGFGAALVEFDSWLKSFMPQLGEDDLLLISADHGCDPITQGSDHSREYVPLLAWSPRLNAGVDLGTRNCFCDIAATIQDNFSLPIGAGVSFLSQLEHTSR